MTIDIHPFNSYTANGCTPPPAEEAKCKDTRRDRIGEALDLLNAERNVSAKEREELRMQRDWANRQMDEARHDAQKAHVEWRDAYDRVNTELGAVRSTEAGLHAQIRELNVELAAERKKSEHLQGQLRMAREAASECYREFDMLRASTVKPAKIGEIPVNFVLDVNMPPDTLEIRNSNGQTIKVTGLG